MSIFLNSFNIERIHSVSERLLKDLYEIINCTQICYGFLFLLVMEGLYYSLGAGAAALLLTVGSAPLASRAMSGIFWFFRYRFTITPILLVMPIFALLGLLIPLAAYRFLSKKSVVERLREAE